MSADLYRVILIIISAFGLIVGGIYLVMYGRPVKRWFSVRTRDASGWVLVVWLLYLWSLFRLVTGWFGARNTPDQPIIAAVIAISLGFLLDGALLHRLLTFMKVRREEREHPTIICPTCRGTGVVSAEAKG